MGHPVCVFALFLHSRTPYSRMKEQEQEAEDTRTYRSILVLVWVGGIVLAVVYYIWFLIHSFSN